jgi:tellurite resistance protein
MGMSKTSNKNCPQCQRELTLWHKGYFIGDLEFCDYKCRDKYEERLEKEPELKEPTENLHPDRQLTESPPSTTHKVVEELKKTSTKPSQKKPLVKTEKIPEQSQTRRSKTLKEITYGDSATATITPPKKRTTPPAKKTKTSSGEWKMPIFLGLFYSLLTVAIVAVALKFLFNFSMSFNFFVVATVIMQILLTMLFRAGDKWQLEAAILENRRKIQENKRMSRAREAKRKSDKITKERRAKQAREKEGQDKIKAISKSPNLTALEAAKVALSVTKNGPPLEELKSVVSILKSPAKIEEALQSVNKDLRATYIEEIEASYKGKRIAKTRTHYDSQFKVDLENCMSLGMNAIRDNLGLEDVTANTSSSSSKRKIEKTKSWKEIKKDLK